MNTQTTDKKDEAEKKAAVAKEQMKKNDNGNKPASDKKNDN